MVTAIEKEKKETTKKGKMEGELSGPGIPSGKLTFAN
jgi:hypothetical protein